MRKTGVSLIVAANLLLIYASLGALAYTGTHAHLGESPAQYARPWPVVLTCIAAASGIVLALVPLRRGELWALWTSLAMLMVLLAMRLITDPRCRVVLDPHQHGCHTFMIAILAGFAGVALASFARKRRPH